MLYVKEFFKPIKEIKNGIDQELANRLVSAAIAFTKITNQSAYIIDYHQQGFAYMSSHPLFLCGYTAEQVKEWGYRYYARVVPEEDIKMLLEINQKGFDFFYSLPIEQRAKGFISYDFRIVHPQRQPLLVNQRLTPLYLTDDGNIWLALCIINISTNKQPGNVVIQMLDEPTQHRYSFESKRFVTFKPTLLSEREKQVLEFAARGYSEQETADELFVDLNTVKYHKKNLYLKLDVKNMAEAIYCAGSGNLF
jgi:DNA-binding CsgD family transcriptional regulator